MKFNKCSYVIALIMICLFGVSAQENTRPKRQLTLSVFNANSLLPGSGDLGITSSIVHPGLDLGVGWSFRMKPKSEWLVNAKVGYFYHRLSEHAIQLFGEFGYRRYFCKHHFNVSALFAGGYLHAFPDLQVFKINQDGIYQEAGKWGRPQAMLGLSIVPAYSWQWKNRRDYSVFLGYRLMFQMPFINNYVNILPYTSLHLGMTASLDQIFKMKRS